jgi:hypothetical protein
MLLAAIIILLGTRIPPLTLASFVVATLIFLGFAIGRSVSFAADGKPNKHLLQGLMSDLVLGAANVFHLMIALI